LFLIAHVKKPSSLPIDLAGKTERKRVRSRQSSDESEILSNSFLLSILTASCGTCLSSIDAFAISISEALRTSSRTGVCTSSLTVSVPLKVSWSTFGTMRTEYSVGTTCFGSFPGAAAKSNGFSALMLLAKLIAMAKARTQRRTPSLKLKEDAFAISLDYGNKSRTARDKCRQAVTN
jgi:hypothetical protein